MEIKNKKTDSPANSASKAFIGGSIFAAACIVIYLFALIQGTVRIYLSIEQRKITAEQEFDWIASVALTAGIQGFMDQNFIRTMNNALTSSQSIEALIITGADSGYTFEKHEGRAINWVNNSPRFNSRFSFLKQDLYKPLSIPDVRNANIKAIAGAFDYNGITRILKETLIIILAGFALAFFTMLLQMLVKKPANGQMIHVDNKKTRSEPARVYEEQDSVFTGESSPKGLYSARTNIGWEEYIKDRLDSELHRCSSTEKDLSLLLIEFINITNDDMFRNITDTAVNFFTSRDLLFEYGRWGIAALLPGSELDASISKSEKFLQKMTEKFPGSFTSLTGSRLCIGLTSRAGRLLNADRLMLEAREALKKAKSENKTSIIAFKSDPEKYRAFIAAQN